MKLKNIIMFILILAVLSSFSLSLNKENDLLIYFYPTNVSTTVVDESTVSDQYNGTASGGINFTINGTNNAKMSLDGLDDDVITGQVPQNTSHFTIMMWVNWSSNQNTTSAMIFQQYDNSSLWSNYFYFRDNDFKAYIRDGVSSYSYANVELIDGIDKDKWYHLAIVREGDSLYTYLNGTLNDTLTGLGNYDYDVDSVRIGNLHPDQGTTYKLAGDLSNILLYNTSLNATEISEIYDKNFTKYLNTISINEINITPVTPFWNDNLSCNIDITGQDYYFIEWYNNDNSLNTTVFNETYDSTDNENYYLYFNYTKQGNPSTVLWQTKHGALDTYNSSVPIGCIRDTIELRFYSSCSCTLDAESYGQCYNGSNWINITEIESEFVGTCSGTANGDETKALDGNYSTDSCFQDSPKSWDSQFCDQSYCEKSRIYEEALYQIYENLTTGFNAGDNISCKVTGINGSNSLSAQSDEVYILGSNLTELNLTNETIAGQDLFCNYAGNNIDNVSVFWYDDNVNIFNETLYGDSNISTLDGSLVDSSSTYNCSATSYPYQNSTVSEIVSENNISSLLDLIQEVNVTPTTAYWDTSELTCNYATSFVELAYSRFYVNNVAQSFITGSVEEVNVSSNKFNYTGGNPANFNDGNYGTFFTPSSIDATYYIYKNYTLYDDKQNYDLELKSCYEGFYEDNYTIPSSCINYSKNNEANNLSLRFRYKYYVFAGTTSIVYPECKNATDTWEIITTHNCVSAPNQAFRIYESSVHSLFTNDTVMATGNYSANDNITCEATVENNSIIFSLNSTAIRILGSFLDEANITNETLSNQPLYCNYAGTHINNVSVEWYDDDVNIFNETVFGDSNTSTLNESYVDGNSIYYCIVNSKPVENSTVSVLYSENNISDLLASNITELNITAENFIQQNLSCNYAGINIDNISAMWYDNLTSIYNETVVGSSGTSILPFTYVNSTTGIYYCQINASPYENQALSFRSSSNNITGLIDMVESVNQNNTELFWDTEENLCYANFTSNDDFDLNFYIDGTLRNFDSFNIKNTYNESAVNYSLSGGSPTNADNAVDDNLSSYSTLDRLSSTIYRYVNVRYNLSKNFGNSKIRLKEGYDTEIINTSGNVTDACNNYARGQGEMVVQDLYEWKSDISGTGWYRSATCNNGSDFVDVISETFITSEDLLNVYEIYLEINTYENISINSTTLQTNTTVLCEARGYNGTKFVSENTTSITVNGAKLSDLGFLQDTSAYNSSYTTNFTSTHNDSIRIKWFVDDIENSSYENLTTINESAYIPNQNLTVSITAYDDEDNANQSNISFIINYKNVTIQPTSISLVSDFPENTSSSVRIEHDVKQTFTYNFTATINDTENINITLESNGTTLENISSFNINYTIFTYNNTNQSNYIGNITINRTDDNIYWYVPINITVSQNVGKLDFINETTSDWIAIFYSDLITKTWYLNNTGNRTLTSCNMTIIDTNGEGINDWIFLTDENFNIEVDTVKDITVGFQSTRDGVVFEAYPKVECIATGSGDVAVYETGLPEISITTSIPTTATPPSSGGGGGATVEFVVAPTNESFLIKTIFNSLNYEKLGQAGKDFQETFGSLLEYEIQNNRDEDIIVDLSCDVKNPNNICDWITISPNRIEVPAKRKQSFVVNGSIPEEVRVGEEYTFNIIGKSQLQQFSLIETSSGNLIKIVGESAFERFILKIGSPAFNTQLPTGGFIAIGILLWISTSLLLNNIGFISKLVPWLKTSIFWTGAIVVSFVILILA